MSTAKLAREVKVLFDAVSADDLRAAKNNGDATVGDVFLEFDNSENHVIGRVYLGSALALDPCGRHHHVLAPNGVSNRCERFWESLERQLELRELSLSAGEGDPCDQFAERLFSMEEI